MKLNSDKSKIVVGILNKNCGLQLQQCLDSLCNQSFNDFEIVVVDGNSQDNSIHVLKKYFETYDNIHYFIQQSKGTGMARNELIDYVKQTFPNCERIIWGDSENCYSVNYVSSFLEVDADVISGKNVIMSKSPLGQSLWWYYNGIQNGAVSGNNESIKFKVFQTHKYAELTRGEDFFFHEELKTKGYTFKHCSPAVCYVSTLENFKEFIIWTKRKALSSVEFGKKNGKTLQLSLRYFSLSLLMLCYLFFALFSFFFFPFSILFFLVPPLMFSLFFWFKGKKYVHQLKCITILYFIPVIVLHVLIVFSILLKSRMSK